MTACSTVPEAVFGVVVNSSLPEVQYSVQDVNCSNSYSYDLQGCKYNIASASICGVQGSSSIAGAICREGKSKYTLQLMLIW